MNKVEPKRDSNKQLLDEVFESGMVKVEVLVSADTTSSGDSKETESNNCFVRHRFEKNNDKHTIAWNIVRHCSSKPCITRATY